MADKFLDKTGLAYFWEKIKAYFQSQHTTPPEYTIVRLANEEVGYAASYVLKKDGTQVGATINIPKDYLVRSGEVKTVTVADEPYEGAVVGDKYLDFVVNTVDDSGNTSHIYIPVSDLVDAYIAGNGIQISNNNYISVKVSQQGVDHGLGVGGDGLTVNMVTPSINGVGGTHGAMYAADKEKLDNLHIVGVFTSDSDTDPVIEGVDGLVPAPTWAERSKFLRGDGTWAEPISGGDATDVQINGISITSNDVANIQTEGVYNASTNKIATMSDVTSATPNVGHLKTDNTTAQTPSASESFTGDINLHKVAKTGSYNDLNDKPTIPSSGDFVTSLGTSGNKVTWTKNGVTNKLTVPYATNAGTADKLGSSTVGGAKTRPIYLNAGSPTAITSMSMRYFGWPVDEYTALDSISNLYLNAGANVCAHIKPDYVDVEYTNDNGVTWLDYGATDEQKVQIFTTSGGFRVGKKTTSSSTNVTVDDAVRITVHAGAGFYCHSLFMLFRFFCPAACKLKVEYTTYSDTTTWTESGTYTFQGNPTYLMIPFDKYIFGNNGVHDFRLTLQYNGTGYVTYGHRISMIKIFSNNIYSGNSDLAKTGHLYSYDWEKNATFPANVTASKFIKSGGTSSQFLKADGSVDSNTYATTSQVNNNIVKMNGYSGAYGITPLSLCAFAVWQGGITSTMESLTTSGGLNSKPPVTSASPTISFPIGCKIYYHPDATPFTLSTAFTSKNFYATYDDVDARYTAVTGSSISLGSQSASSVYLRVSIDNGYWKPYYKSGETTEIIVTSNNLVSDNFYIYLGKTVGSTGYKFQLEDNNPLYYYDGTNLIDWASYQASYTAGSGISINNNVISVNLPYKKEIISASSFNTNSSYSKGLQDYASNLTSGTYKVTLQVHLYIVSNTDNMMPAACVVNVCMRNKATSSSNFQYILGATETLGDGTLPETAISTGKGIISKTLNVVGFLEVTGNEDSSGYLEAIFTTNSSLNVLIGNPVPRDGTYDGFCSGNDFVLLEKIA